MQPLEYIIRSKLIPNLTGRRAPSDSERELFSQPARSGGMGLINPSTLSQSEFHSSSLISQPLVNILSHNYGYNEETLIEQQTSIKEVMKMKLNGHSTAATQLSAMLPSNLQLAMHGPMSRKRSIQLAYRAPYRRVWVYPSQDRLPRCTSS